MKGTLDVCLVYGSNARHADLVGLIDSDHISDLEIKRALVVGLVQCLVLKAENLLCYMMGFPFKILVLQGLRERARCDGTACTLWRFIGDTLIL